MRKQCVIAPLCRAQRSDPCLELVRAAGPKPDVRTAEGIGRLLVPA
jgi:hypothetical protein